MTRRSLFSGFALTLTGCGLIAGTGDFTDQPTSGGNGGAGASTSSGGSAATDASSSSGASTSSSTATGEGGAGTGGGGDGGSPTCLGCGEYFNPCYLGTMGQLDCASATLCQGQAQDAFNLLTTCVCQSCRAECGSSCVGSSAIEQICKTCANAAVTDRALCASAYTACQDAG